MSEWRILHGDVRERLKDLPDGFFQCVVTSPPYWGLRDYGIRGQIGMEGAYQTYVGVMVEVFAEVWRVLRSDGVLWLNLGDCYSGSWGARGRGEHTNIDPHLQYAYDMEMAAAVNELRWILARLTEAESPLPPAQER